MVHQIPQQETSVPPTNSPSTIRTYVRKDGQEHKVGKVIRGGPAGLTWGRVMRSSIPRPSEEAVIRLREGLHTRIAERRRALPAELTVIEALVRMGELDGAVHALEDQRLALRTLSIGLKAVVADAAAEQSVERALDAWRDLPVTVSTGSGRGPAGRGSGTRPRLALALAAAMLGVILVPGLREQPLRVFSTRAVHEERAAWSAIHAARERLATFEPTQADAGEVTAEARAVHDRILSLPDRALASKALQAEIRGLLAEQSGALRDLQANPDAKSLLGEVHALSASLGLGVPEPQVQPPAPASEIPLPPALEQVPPQQVPPPQTAPEQLAPEPERHVPDLPLPEQRAPKPPDTGGLDVNPAGQAPRPDRPNARVPDGPTPDLAP